MKLFKSTRTQSFFQLLLLVKFVVGFYPAQGQLKALHNKIEKQTGKVKAQDNEVKEQHNEVATQHNNFTAQATPHEWFIYLSSIQTSFLTAFVNSSPEKRNFVGMSVDTSILYINQVIWDKFNCFPRLILLGHFIRLPKQANSWGGFIYLAPHYNHVANWEIVPRLGIGFSNVKIDTVPANSTNANNPQSEAAEEAEDNAYNAEETPLKQGFHWDLSYNLDAHLKLTPNWHLTFGLGMNYIPAFNALNPKNEAESKRKNVSTYKTIHIGCRYTIKPSTVTYLPLKNPSKSRVDIGLFSSLQKVHSDNENSDQNEHNKKQIYPILGLYSHWSFRYYNHHAVTLTNELAYDWALEAILKEKRAAFTNGKELKISLGHEFLWGKLIFGQQIGVYLFRNMFTTRDEMYYIKLYLHYQLPANFFIGSHAQTPLRNIKFNLVDLRIGLSF